MTPVPPCLDGDFRGTSHRTLVRRRHHVRVLTIFLSALVTVHAWAPATTTINHKRTPYGPRESFLQRNYANDLVVEAPPTTLARSKRDKTNGLTREQEIQYSFQIRTLRAAMRLREDMVQNQNGLHVHPSELEWAKACGTTRRELRRILTEGQAARSALIEANIGLVTALSKRHYYALKQAMEAGDGVGTILGLSDLIQEGNLGLMKAAERYQPEKGFRFSTYATWWVRQRILKAVSDSSRTIRLPAHVHSTLQKIKKAKTYMKSELGREPTPSEIAQYCEISIKKLNKYTSSTRNVLSLERPLRTASFKDDTRTLGDTLASQSPTPEEDAEDEYLRQDVRNVMNTELLQKERDVIAHRFGLEDGKSRSIDETAQLLGISRDQVRLVEARALNKLRCPQRNFRLKEYVASDELHVSALPGNNSDKRSSTTAATATAAADRFWFF